MPMDVEVSHALQGRLGAAEQLIWTGRPRQGLVLRGSDVFLIPFSILWCGFAIFWTISASRSEGAPMFWLFGVPFVAVGLYFVVGRFVHDAKLRERTVYGLSNERILILTGWFQRELKSLNLRTLSDITLTERGDGRGTITFGPTSPWDSWLSGSAWPGMGATQTPRFDNIEDVKRIYDLIRDAQRRA